MASEQLETIIQAMRSRPSQTDSSIEEQRAGFEAFGSLSPLAEDVLCEPVDAGGVPAEWIVAPGASDEHVIYYLHGGGYCIGSIGTHRELASRISRAARARVLIVDSTGWRRSTRSRLPWRMRPPAIAGCSRRASTRHELSSSATRRAVGSRLQRWWRCAMREIRCRRRRSASRPGSTWNVSEQR